MIKMLFYKYIATPLTMLWFVITLWAVKHMPLVERNKNVRVYYDSNINRYIPQFKTRWAWNGFFTKRAGYWLWDVPYREEFFTFNEAVLFLRKREEEAHIQKTKRVSQVVIEENWRGL